MPQPHEFTIHSGPERTTTVTGRAQAVAQAKEISKRTWRPIQVKRSDGTVNMTFQRGWLQGYRYETRDRSNRRH